jgi:uncharacterized protein (TIGR02001 family)
MKKTTCIFAALAMASLLSAQTVAPTPPPAETPASSWVLTSAVASQYMFRGARLGGVSFQPSLEYDAGNLGLGVWANTPIKNKVVGQSDPEFDFYGFYSMDIAKDVSVVPGFTAYTYPNANKSNGFYKGTFEPNIALDYTIGQFKLTPKLYYDVVLKGPTAELTAAFAVPLKDLGTELDFTGAAGTFIWKSYAADTTPDIKNWGDYYLVGVSMPYQVSKDSKLSLGWAYTKGSNNYLKQGTDGKVPNSAAVGRGVVTLSYIVTF